MFKIKFSTRIDEQFLRIFLAFLTFYVTGGGKGVGGALDLANTFHVKLISHPVELFIELFRCHFERKLVVFHNRSRLIEGHLVCLRSGLKMFFILLVIKSVH